MKNTELKNKDNLNIWKEVEVTDPRWLKPANIGGNKITQIHFQVYIS